MRGKVALGIAALVAAVGTVVAVAHTRAPGLRLVFWHIDDEQSNGDLFFTSASGGTPKRYCPTKADRMSPIAFSRDGSRLAYGVSDGPIGPWRLHAANGADCQDDRIVAKTESSLDAIAFSPDGAWLTYSTYLRRPAGNPRRVQRAHDGGDREVFLVGQGEPVALSTDDGDDDFPAWSPDGARIAFVSTRDGEGDVYLTDATTRRITRLTSGGLVRSAGIAWSPDGSAIAIARGPADQRDIVTVSPTTGGELRTVTTYRDINAALSLERAEVDAIAWSPTGTHLVATVSRTSIGMRQTVYWARVISIALDTGAIKVLVDGQARCPAIAPDGKSVAMSISRSMPPNEQVIGAVPIGGGSTDDLVTSAGCPVWLSPPGQ